MSHRRLHLLLLATAIVVLAAGALFFLRGRLFPRDPVWARVERTRVWRVGMDPSFPPFEMTAKDGSVVGFDVDLARAIAARWGVRVEIVGIGFDGLTDAVSAHKVDAAISAIPYDPLLTRDVRYSDPYFDAGWRVVVPHASAIRDLADLAGKRVAVEWGSEGDVWARRLQRQYTNVHLVLKPSLDEALAALRAGEADAAIVDGVTYRLHAREWRQVGAPLSHEPYVIVMPIDAYRLQEQVNRALRGLKATGELANLEGKWLEKRKSKE